MPKFELAVPHNSSRDETVQRLQAFSEKVREKFGDQIKDVRQDWNDNQMTFGFKTLGIEITGEMIVEDEAVTVRGDLPFAAAMFKGKIVGTIEEQLQKLLT